MHIHELEDWPAFHWSPRIAEPLASVRHKQGRLIGHMEALGFSLQQEAVLKTLTADVLKSSEIEGEKLDAEQVRWSIARRLGMDIGALKPVDRDVHAGRLGSHWERTRSFRSTEGEASRWREWFEGDDHTDPVLRAGLALLWFVTIHPFSDGNGRIARAVADMALARSENSPPKILQHVVPDPARAQRLLRHSGTNAERDDGHHALDGMVPRMFGPRHRWSPGNLKPRSRQGAFLGTYCRREAQQQAAACRQPFARRVRRPSDDVQIRHNCQVLAGHSVQGRSRTDRSRDPRSQSQRRPEYELFTCPIAESVSTP